MYTRFKITEVFEIQYPTGEKQKIMQSQTFRAMSFEDGIVQCFTIRNTDVDLSFIKEGNNLIVDLLEGDIWHINEKPVPFERDLLKPLTFDWDSLDSISFD